MNYLIRSRRTGHYWNGMGWTANVDLAKRFPKAPFIMKTKEEIVRLENG